jgi:hypothetical protein
VLTPADVAHHIDKWAFTVPFVCGATNLGEALRRIAEGAAMIRSKGEAGTGDVVEAVTHMRADLRRDPPARQSRCATRSSTPRRRSCRRRRARPLRSPRTGKLPVVLFTAGGIATPADAALMMQLGAEGVFVGSGIFKSGDPAQRAEGDRRGDHALRRRRRDRQGLRGPRRGRWSVRAAFVECQQHGVKVLAGVEDHWVARRALEEDAGQLQGVIWFVPMDVWHAVDTPMLEINLWHPSGANAAADDALTTSVLGCLTRHGLQARFDEGRLEIAARWQKRI